MNDIGGDIAHPKLPPGPTPYPLIGNLAQVDLHNPHRSFVQWKHKYGSIYTVWLPKPQVVIAGAEELNDVLVNGTNADIFADRPTFSFVFGIFNGHQPDGDGIIIARQQIWQKNRRFALHAFRDLGMGRPPMETRICYHKDALINRLAGAAIQSNGQITDLYVQFSFCLGNIIQDMVMGRHHEYNDPEFIHFKELIDRTIKQTNSFQMLFVDRFPWLRAFVPAYWRYIRDGFALQRLFLHEIDVRIQHLNGQQQLQDGRQNDDTEPDCFIDAYLLAAMAEGNHLDDPALRLTLALCAGDLWAAGQETVVNTITWAIIYMIHYPDVQIKLQTELDQKLQGRAFTLADRTSLPYFRATIDELQRVVNILPWSLPHSTSQAVTISGSDGRRWTIPKDMIVMPQYGAVHMDPMHFPQPEVFRPERFLDMEGNYCASELLKPFGMGKRSCLGESLAKMELPILFASLLQNFNFGPVRDGMPSMRRNLGLTSSPDPFKCTIRKRQDEVILTN